MVSCSLVGMVESWRSGVSFLEARDLVPWLAFGSFGCLSVFPLPWNVVNRLPSSGRGLYFRFEYVTIDFLGIVLSVLYTAPTSHIPVDVSLVICLVFFSLATTGSPA